MQKIVQVDKGFQLEIECDLCDNRYQTTQETVDACCVDAMGFGWEDTQDDQHWICPDCCHEMDEEHFQDDWDDDEDDDFWDEEE